MTQYNFLKNNLCWFVLVLFLVGCQHKRPPDVPDALLVLPNAVNVQFSTSYGTQQVSYRLNACYPGKTVIDSLSAGMLLKGWVLLPDDSLNPGHKLNHARGEWSTFWDQNNNYIYQWMEDWRSPKGDIIRYALRYTAKNSEKPEGNCSMEVYGIFTPKKLFDETTSGASSTAK